MITRAILFAGAALALAPATFAQAKTYKVGGGITQQLAQVESATELETFTGRTDKVTGTITFDKVKKTGSGKIVVDAGSIDTGIPLRNDHMRSEGWLSTEKNPNITFVTTKVTSAGGDKFKVVGKLTLKGVTKTVSTTATVKHQAASAATAKAGFKGDVLRVTTAFNVKLKDFNIVVSGPAVGKVADTVRIGITVYAQSGA